MIRRLLTLLAAALLAASTLALTTTPEDLTLFLRVDGNSCPGTTYLSSVAGSDELNCGYIGGLPFGEIFTQTGAASAAQSYNTSGAFPASDSGMPINLDAGRDVAGEIVVGSYTGIGGGAGQIVVDVELDVITADGTETIGTTTEEVLADPAAGQTPVPFTFDIADELDLVEVTDVELTVTVRGAHVLHGFKTANGASKVTVPHVVIEDDGTDGGDGTA